MLCNTELSANCALEAVKKSKLVVLDVETSGLDRWNNHIIGWVLTIGPDPEDSFYLPVRHLGGGNIPGGSVPTEATNWDGTIHPIELSLAEIFKDPRISVVFHNAQFDLWFARRHGVTISGRMYDTMVNASLIYEYNPSYSLNECCKYMGVQGKKGEPLYEYLSQLFGGKASKEQMGNYWKTDAKAFIVHDYASGDGTSTWQLFNAQVGIIRRDGLQTVFDVESRVIPVIARMTWDGIRIDLDRLDWVEKECLRRLEEAKSKLPPGLNLSSPKQVKGYFDSNGVKNYPKTDKGNPSFTGAWLSQEELGRPIVEARKYATLLSTFISPLKTTHIRNGRVHAQYAQSRDENHGTVTGRFSSFSPNMQQIPKRDKETGKLFRSIFVPDEGNIWASADWSQTEPCLLAHYLSYRDKNNTLSVGYTQNPPIDAHSAVASLAGIDRQSAKVLNQGIIGSMGENRVVRELTARGKTEEQARGVFRKYMAALPSLLPLQKEMIEGYKLRGYVKTILGRRCRLESEEYSYKALNRILQGGNADMIKLKLAEIGEFLEAKKTSVRLLANIHDDISFSFKEEDRDTYLECLKIMTAFGQNDVISISVPIRVDAGEGPNWAVASYKEDK